MDSSTASLDLLPEATDCSRHVKLVPGVYPHDVCVECDLSISLTALYPSHIYCKLSKLSLLHISTNDLHFQHYTHQSFRIQIQIQIAFAYGLGTSEFTGHRHRTYQQCTNLAQNLQIA